MLHFTIILLSLLTIISCQLALKTVDDEDSSSQYLENVMRDLKNQQLLLGDAVPSGAAVAPEQHQQTGTTPLIVERRIQRNDNNNKQLLLPPLSLTKGELAAFYESAVSNGDTVKLNTGNNTYVHAAVHELDQSGGQYFDEKVGGGFSLADNSVHDADDLNGYYYYYYPIKNFIDELSRQPASNSPDITKYSSPNHHESIIETNTIKPHYQYHSHTHQHNVKITSLKDMMDDKKKDKKALEPLFMAISGFVGMAVMFVLSILVLPKFGLKKSLPKSKRNEKIGDIARIALQAIEGQDCTERFACELEKTSRTFNLNDNRFVRLIKRMAPASLGKQMNKATKYGNKRLRCNVIPCKKKINPKKKT